MKRILTGLLAIGMAAATWAVNDDNPCKHPNLGNCTIELENSLNAQVTLVEKGDDQENESGLSKYEPVNITSIVKSRVSVKNKEIMCPDCEEMIPCSISVGSCSPGGMKDEPGTYTGSIHIKCSAHNSSADFDYSVTLKKPEGGGGGGGDHDHDWGEWSYNCDLSGADSDYFRINSSSSSLRAFVLETMNNSKSDNSKRVRGCKVEGCDEVQSRSYSHSARWICSESDSSSHIYHNEEKDAINPALVNGKHRYCVAMGGSCDSIHYVSTGVWVQQTVEKLEVTSKTTTGNLDPDQLPELPEYEPTPSAEYFVRVYKPGQGNEPAKWNTVLKASPNFGSWDLNKVSWTRYPLAEIETILLPRGDEEPGIADFRPTSTGTHIVVARCNYGDEENLPAQAKSVAICVVDPASTVDFQPLPPGSWDAMLKASGNEKPKKGVTIASNGKTQPIRMILHVNRSKLQSRNATLKIESKEKESYAIYKDVECTQSFLKPGERKREVSVTLDEIPNDPENIELTLYFLPLLPDEEVAATLEYESSSVGVDEPGEDKVMITGGCSSCVGDCVPLNGECGLGSVKVNFELGNGQFDQPGGSVRVDSETLDHNLLSLNSFQVTPEGATTVTMNNEGYPTEANTGLYRTTFEYSKAFSGNTAFVNRIVMKTFHSGASTSFAEAVLELHYTESGSIPSVNSFTVKNTVNGVVRNYKYTCAYQVNPDFGGEAADVWTLTRWLGDNTDSAESETVARRDTGSQRIEYRYLGSVSTPLLKEKVTKQKFADGEYEVIESRIGDAVTTYSYDSNRNLTAVRNPDGSSITYTYNTEGKITSETKIIGNLTTVTTYTITDNGIQATRDAERKVNGILTSKSRLVQNYGISSAPDMSIQYDENNVAYTTSTYYVTDQSSPFYGRVRLRMNPDGTATITQYERNNSTDTTTSWTGVPNSASSPTAVTLGTKTVTITDSQGRMQSSRSWHVENGTETLVSEQVNTGFDSFGRVTSTRFLDGSTISRTYGCCGVESETDRDGITTTYAYDDLTKRVSYTVRDGVTTLYTYDDAGNQTAVTVKGRNGNEITTTSEYVNGELSAEVDALGNRTTYTRTYTRGANDKVTYTEKTINPDSSTRIVTMENGAQVSITGSAVYPQTFEYGPNWQKTLPQNQTVYTDMLGRQYKTEYADGNTETQYYNAKQQLVRSVTPAGRTTLYEYDALGRQVKQAIDMNGNNLIDSADLVTSISYSYGMENDTTVAITTVTQSQNNDSKVVSIEKRSVDGLESWITDVSGLTTHTKLERLGSGSTRQTVTNPDGTGTITTNQNGRVTSVQNFGSGNASGVGVTYTYDEFNRQAGMTQSDNGSTVSTASVTYNAAGQPLTQTVNGRTTSIAYDVLNRTKTLTLPGERTIVEEYYPTGELKKISGADTYTQEWTYDSIWGQKATLTTYKNSSTPQITTWTYDNRGNVASKKYADNNGPTYTYDGDGNMLTRTWARGVTTTLTYDMASRVTTQSYSDETPSITVSYDFLNRMATVTDAAGTRNFTYNTLSQLENETVPNIVNLRNSYSYDTYGRKVLRQLQSGTNVLASSSRTYDAHSRIASLGSGTDRLFYTYRPGPLLQTAAWRNADDVTLNTRTYEYDTLNRLTGIKLNNAQEVSYTLNDRDQRTAAEYASNGAWNFSYDDKSQLTGAEKTTESGTEFFNYTYDGIGNRVTATELTDTWNYTSNLLNQYTAINSLSPTYDLDGNMLTTGDGWTYTWNGENRLIRAVKGGTVVEMAYDYMGRRISKTTTGGTFLDFFTSGQHNYRYVYDEYKLIAVYDGNDLVMTFTWQPDSVDLDVPVSMTYDGETYYYVTDGNKNVTALLDAEGNRVAKYAYGPFGQILHMEGELAEINPFRFSSEYYDDETGLVYYNFRYYNPNLGRWIKRDPLEEEDSINIYNFCNNYALNGIDYLGLSRYWEWGGWVDYTIVGTLIHIVHEGVVAPVGLGEDWAVVLQYRDRAQMLEAYVQGRGYQNYADFEFQNRNRTSYGSSDLIQALRSCGLVAIDTVFEANMTAVTAGLSNARPNMSIFKPDKKQKAIWEYSNSARGFALEGRLGHYRYRVQDGWKQTEKNFPTWDYIHPKFGHVSVKSIDTTLKTYQKPSQLKATLKRYINNAAKGKTLPTYSQQRWLDVIIPDVDMSQKHAQAIMEAVQYGKSKNINLNVILWKE